MRLLTLVGIVWLVLALGTIGYFFFLDSQIPPDLEHGLRASAAQVKYLLPGPSAQ